MKRLSLLLLVLLMHTTHALAELTDTEIWNKVKARMNGDTGYSLRADYRGPEGHFLCMWMIGVESVFQNAVRMMAAKEGAGR